MAAISPPPVYAENTRLAELGTAELFAVTVLRLWAAGHEEPGSAVPDWRSGFAAAGIEQHGVLSFGCLMDIIASTALRTIRVRLLRSTTLGRDEGRLLQLVSLLQRDRNDLAAALMSEWLPPVAVRLAGRVGQALAKSLKAGRLIVPLRHAQAADYPLLVSTAHAMPGLVLLH